ncbi:MAG: response regulator transcription factor [Planctomycetota bacterium]
MHKATAMVEAHRILLVEDEENLAHFITLNLESEGYRVAHAGNLAEARSRRAQEAFDLTVLDLMLPDGSGLQLLDELRRTSSDELVLVLTAKSTTDDVIRGLRSGADDYLAKPFALEEFLLRVEALLRRRQITAGHGSRRRLAFGGNRVDLVSGEATTVHGPARLTETELRLLRCFLAHRGEDLRRQELLAEVWELPTERGASSRSLDNFVLRLRRLLELDPTRPVYFRTVYGIGYRFDPGEDCSLS